MNANNTFLSSAALKDRAKEMLEGKYGTFILVTLLVGVITLVAQIIVEFAGSMFFGMLTLLKELLENNFSLDQIQLLLDDDAYIQTYTEWYDAMNYVLQLIVSIFTSVFQVGISLFCLNVTCGRALKYSDLFYGFRTQFGKSLKLATVLILVNELCYLPSNILSYLIRHNASRNFILIMILIFAMCLILYIPCSLAISQMFLLLLDFPGYSAGELIKLSNHIMKGHKGRLFYIQLSFLPLILLSLLTFGIGNLWITPYMNITYTLFFLNLMQERTGTD